MTKEVYLQIGERNKCVSFNSSNDLSDCDALRNKLRECSEKDTDLRQRLEGCTKILFKKLKVKKTTGELVRVDVEEWDEIEEDSDLQVVFCKEVMEAPPTVTSIFLQEVDQNTSIFDLDNGTGKVTFVLPDVNQPTTSENVSILTNESQEPPSSNLTPPTPSTSSGSVTKKVKKSHGKRKKKSPFTFYTIPPGETFIELPALPNNLKEIVEQKKVVSKCSKFIAFFAKYLRETCEDEPSKEDYDVMARSICKLFPELRLNSHQQPHAIVRKHLSNSVRNAKSRERKQLVDLTHTLPDGEEVDDVAGTSTKTKQSQKGRRRVLSASLAASASHVPTEAETALSVTLEAELKGSSHLGATTHVICMVKATFDRRKDAISKLPHDTGAATVTNLYPHLLQPKLLLIEMCLRLNKKTEVLMKAMEDFLERIARFLSPTQATETAKEMLDLLVVMHRDMKPRNASKKAFAPVTVKEAFQPNTNELLTFELEGPRLVCYHEEGEIVSAFIVADKVIQMKLEDLKPPAMMLSLMAAYHCWDAEFPGMHKSFLWTFDDFVLGVKRPNQPTRFLEFSRELHKFEKQN